MNYDRMKTMVAKFIERYGGEVKLKHRVDSQIDDVDGTRRYSNLTTKVKAVIRPFSPLYVDGDLIEKTDREVFIAGNEIAYPNLDDDIEILGEDYRIIDIKDVTPDNSNTIVYRLQTRAYAPAEAIDILRVPLGTLDVGTRVVDPFDFMDIVWIVAGQSHHSTGTTTLISLNVRDQESYDAYSVGYGTDYPWGQSGLRDYLQSTFLEENLSYQLRDILQTVSIETEDMTVSDEISVPSYIELFDEEPTDSEGSSGKHLPFFTSDARRIGRQYTDNEPITYWTRNVYSFDEDDGTGQIWCVDTDGTSTIVSDGSSYGIRPMIYLSRRLDVYLNDDGDYEILYD